VDVSVAAAARTATFPLSDGIAGLCPLAVKQAIAKLAHYFSRARTIPQKKAKPLFF
jgi:hypothetical protein